MLNFLDPWKDAADKGYQLIQSFYALGAGGLTGLGLGQSRQKTIYMPEPHNDFIFSIIGEELGLIGCLVIISLFVFLIWRGVKVAMEARDTYGSLLAMGIPSNNKYSCCNWFNACNWSSPSFYKLWWNIISYNHDGNGRVIKYI